MSGPPRPELLPTAEELHRLRDVARGAAGADLIVRGGSVLAVHTGESLPRDVVIAGRHIAAVTPVGRCDAADVIDARGLHVVPAFIDAHLHIEYTMLTPGQLARLSVPRGTVTVLTDPDCMANVAGLPGMDLMRRTSTPLRIFEQVSPTTPTNPRLERGGQAVAETDVLDRLSSPAAVTLGESNPYDYSRTATERYHAALLAGRRITGHTGGHDEEALWGYLAGGVGDDHNASTPAAALDRIRLGAMLTVMSGSMNDNTLTMFADLDAVRPALGHMCFCADDKHVLDLDREGHIDHSVRQAIALGVPVQIAYRMATLTPALYYRLDQLVGSITPARLADLQLVGDLRAVRPEAVVVGGELVAEGGRALFDGDPPVPGRFRETIRLPDRVEDVDLRVPAAGASATVRVMRMYDGYFKRAVTAVLPVRDGAVQIDVEQDVLKIAVVDRYHGDGACGIGFVSGFGLRRGAIAVSTTCTNANISVVGATDAEMRRCVDAVRQAGGGFAVVDGDDVLAVVPLPVGGMMSEAPWEDVRDQLAAAHEAAAGLGCAIESPFMVLSFVGLATVPELGLTELGLIDSASQSFVDVVV